MRVTLEWFGNGPLSDLCYHLQLTQGERGRTTAAPSRASSLSAATGRTCRESMAREILKVPFHTTCVAQNRIPLACIAAVVFT
jgi:hypothetical protein